MPETRSAVPKSIIQLILIPAVITLAITILRLVGELEHWPSPWFVSGAGGGGAIVGISWLPIIFGPWFALKLAGNGEGPASAGKAIGYTLLGMVVFVLGSFIVFRSMAHSPVNAVMGFILMFAAVFVPWRAWQALTKTLLAYAFAARIPVLIVMFLAMQGNWGTHYDAVPPGFPASTGFWHKYLVLAVLPQMFLWVGYTVLLGSLIGIITTAIVRRGKPAPQAASAG